jgi:predicted cupin superfamily sugar epimerase
MPDFDINQIIQILQLQPLPGEGGLFRQTYRSEEAIPSAGLPERYQGPGELSRPFGTAILYLLTNEPAGAAGETPGGSWAAGRHSAAFSAFHRLQTDEIFHFYLGDPLELTLLFADGSSRQVILGQDLLNGQQVQFVVPRGVWQGSRLMPGGRFALVGTTMAPGYTDADYEQGDRSTLLAKYPHERERILALTR